MGIANKKENPYIPFPDCPSSGSESTYSTSSDSINNGLTEEFTRSMFYLDGTLVREPEFCPREITNWVNVFLSPQDITCDDETLMRTVATCIRTGVATITIHPMHHSYPLCISIKVPGDYHSNKASIFAAAELQADWYRQEVRSGKVRVNRDLLFRRSA
ncbi:hypothetical protein PENANT_c013G06082 [Penicillium antarcticum]|uniref:Uncharacterized protein n=1 Tax=Penicillium antarcticum TaxID=416450 RepID=A0A1V6Q5A1_9EURO|nr:uncharacterized protein N7508_004226 [Penicillium antarcticum]KAJ5308847.1 hypothetical protein N7508_004226 [Penicillium antarcticum]OQD84420.1 hypothetical protein PENANT_c013G06082 [Penicillium antarcticum]